ncbi:murein transglycosylase A [Paraburkholderia oxyphila]|uniref:murein transglycosylase A n=1 Tax=Paraburkholderia oxyphila TaxID=614212 RepID=UPI000487D49A|nr:murein transglycosylase A [Paraburkholderia oxyphila]
MDRALFLLAAAATALAGCASDNPASSVVIGPATQTQAAKAQATAPAQPAAMAPAANAPQAPSAPTAAASPATMAAPATPATPSAPTLPPPTASATPSAPAPTAEASPSGALSPSAAPAAAFATRHAWYQAARFSDLPGWSTDDLGGSLDAFKRSCGVLGARNGWAAPCAAARSVDAASAAAIRRFFETYFDVYQIRNTDRSSDGTMTGYYEPLLNGSRQPGGAYVYPVYGVPEDMLYLDSRRLAGAAHGSITAARVEGRTVIPLPGAVPGSAKGVYALDLRDSVPDIRDKKMRLRLDGDRIVPYYTRAEIERGVARAPVLAWVDDPVLLYSMQMQGSGKIRMRDGTIRRVAYAEQNGRPFLPPVAHAGASGRKLKVRGIEMEIDVADDSSSSSNGPDLVADANGPQGAAGASNSGESSTGANNDEDDQPVSPLLRGFKLANAGPATSGTAQPAVANAQSTKSASVGAGIATALGANAHPQHAFATSDPSYVFFRPIPDSPNGPIGALGVPLSAGRSVAVDPRTTPLGAPVFVATGDAPQTPGAVNRLMMAQDSGGAIQGAVRADYFYGFGQFAQAEASRTKERLRMWLLLPKGLHVAAQETATKTRGLSNQSNADCLVADPQLCVDDDTGNGQ